ncbi:MAG: tetratricopeptide repeat protein [Terracidiphilus sp.]
MKFPIRTGRKRAGRSAALILLALCAAVCSAAKDKKSQPQPSIKAGPRATSLRVVWLYIQPDTSSQKVAQIQIGREMVVLEKSGPWLNVEANTDVQEVSNDQDTPMIGGEDTPQPLSGWMEAKGIVEETAPNGDQILLGAAANEELLASNPEGPANAARAAGLLYRRLYEMFPNSPLAPEAQWRAADIQWQIEKADVATLPSSKAKDPYMHEQIDETALRKVIKSYPRTRWAALAAFDLIDNKLCGDWEGSAQCPDHESDLYEKYADAYPDGPRTAQALYDAAYRQAVLANMYSANGDNGKSKNAIEHCRALAERLKAHFAGTDYAWRAGTLVYKLDQDIPVFGIDRG